MSGQQPPPGGQWQPDEGQTPGQQPQPSQGEWLNVGQPAPAEAGGGGRRKRGIMAGSIGAVLALVVAAGGVYAYQALSGGGPQPETAMPDTAFAYARIDLDPSADQKIDTLRLLQKFPEFSEVTGITSDKDDLRKRIFEAAMENSECDLSYDDDIKPWIGDRAGVAAIPGDDEPDPLITLQVSDQDQAEEAVEALTRCSGGEETESAGVAFVGEYMLLAETQELADQMAADAEASPLSEDDRFSADMDELDDAGLASFWVDVDTFVDELEKSGATDDFSASELQAFAQVEQVHSYFGAFRAGDDYLEMVVDASTDFSWEAEDNPVVDLPESTVAAFSVSGGADQVDTVWESLRDSVDATQPGLFDQMLSEFEVESGLTLPDDLKTLLGDNLTFAIDSRGLDPETLQQMADPSALNMGLRLTGDKDAAVDLVERLTAKLAESGAGFELATEETDNGVVVATNEDYAGELTGGGDLGGKDEFESAVPDAEDAAGVFYLDLNAIQDVAESFAGSEPGFQEAERYLDPLKSVGAVAYPVEDGYAEVVLRVTFD